MTKQSPGYSLPKAPLYEELPTAKPRTARGGPELAEFRVRLEVVTPILGGSHQTRAIDDVDVIRAASVRGHLRFWWRALYASQCSTAEELYQRESALWGRAATDDRGRSAVEIRIDVNGSGDIDDSDIDLQRTLGAYALWPARAEKRQGQLVEPPAPRRKPGTNFQLIVRASATSDTEVKNALRAWILFGGYGGRTRRGLGSFKVLNDSNGWLPTAATSAAFTSLLGVDIFAAPTKTPGDVPSLGGAALHVGRADRNAQTAWTTALDWLKEFRQGWSGKEGERAREPGTGKAQPQRPSISNWPEADKIRRIKNKTSAHTPRHNATVAWPRAGFGLPIIGQFQKKGRNNERYDEPDGFELRWRAGNTEHDRLASPLIVKALSLADLTGGTKCMSAAIGIQASRWSCVFSYVGGSERTKDGVGVVVSGDEKIVHQPNPWDALGHQAVEDFVVLFDQHAFLAAANVAAVTMKRVSSPDRKRELASLEQLARALDAWDRFDHSASKNLLESVTKSANDLRAVLGSVRGDRVLAGAAQLAEHLGQLGQATPPSRRHVLDLLANAKRRKDEGRFDDAVARLYRAIEAIAQVALKEGHGVDSTEKVPLERVPEPLRSTWATRAKEGVVALGLQDAFALLAGLNDSVGTEFQNAGLSGTKSPLVARNRSILAHGFDRVPEPVFDKLWTSALSLAGIDAASLPSFPALAEAGGKP